jgi:hypothetical protein
MQAPKPRSDVKCVPNIRELFVGALLKYKGKKSWEDLTEEVEKHLGGGRLPDQTLQRMCLQQNRPNARQYVHWEHLKAIAETLQIDAQPFRPNEGGICWFDPRFNPSQISEILELRRRHEAGAQYLNTFAEFVPSSLEPPEFMEAHHQALFRALPRSTFEERQMLISEYNRFGHNSRRRFDDPARTFAYRHHMFASDLNKIANGKGLYKHIPAGVRRSCFRHLIQLLSDHSKKVGLCIATEAIPQITHELREADSWWITDKSLLVWRTRRGSLYWTENKAHVEEKYQMLAVFRENSSLNSNDAAIEFLKSIARLIP